MEAELVAEAGSRDGNPTFVVSMHFSEYGSWRRSDEEGIHWMAGCNCTLKTSSNKDLCTLGTLLVGNDKYRLSTQKGNGPIISIFPLASNHPCIQGYLLPHSVSFSAITFTLALEGITLTPWTTSPVDIFHLSQHTHEQIKSTGKASDVSGQCPDNH